MDIIPDPDPPDALSAFSGLFDLATRMGLTVTWVSPRALANIKACRHCGGHHDGQAWGMTNIAHRNIDLDSDMGPWMATRVLAHELGHVVGPNPNYMPDQVAEYVAETAARLVAFDHFACPDPDVRTESDDYITSMADALSPDTAELARVAGTVAGRAIIQGLNGS